MRNFKELRHKDVLIPYRPIDAFVFQVTTKKN